jgi:hypothetical protein
MLGGFYVLYDEALEASERETALAEEENQPGSVTLSL